MQPDRDDLAMIASAARGRVDAYRLDREREAALRRVRAGQNLIAAWKPMSHDFLSAKAKLQPRDMRGRWIDMGAMVRWLDGVQIGGDHNAKSGVNKDKHWLHGRVNGFDSKTNLYSIKPDGGGPDIHLEGKNIEVVQAAIPDTPGEANKLAGKTNAPNTPNAPNAPSGGAPSAEHIATGLEKKAEFAEYQNADGHDIGSGGVATALRDSAAMIRAQGVNQKTLDAIKAKQQNQKDINAYEGHNAHIGGKSNGYGSAAAELSQALGIEPEKPKKQAPRPNPKDGDPLVGDNGNPVIDKNHDPIHKGDRVSFTLGVGGTDRHTGVAQSTSVDGNGVFVREDKTDRLLFPAARNTTVDKSPAPDPTPPEPVGGNNVPNAPEPPAGPGAFKVGDRVRGYSSDGDRRHGSILSGPDGNGNYQVKMDNSGVTRYSEHELDLQSAPIREIPKKPTPAPKDPLTDRNGQALGVGDRVSTHTGDGNTRFGQIISGPNDRGLWEAKMDNSGKSLYSADELQIDKKANASPNAPSAPDAPGVNAPSDPRQALADRAGLTAEDMKDAPPLLQSVEDLRNLVHNEDVMSAKDAAWFDDYLDEVQVAPAGRTASQFDAIQAHIDENRGNMNDQQHEQISNAISKAREDALANQWEGGNAPSPANENAPSGNNDELGLAKTQFADALGNSADVNDVQAEKLNKMAEAIQPGDTSAVQALDDEVYKLNVSEADFEVLTNAVERLGRVAGSQEAGHPRDAMGNLEYPQEKPAAVPADLPDVTTVASRLISRFDASQRQGADWAVPKDPSKPGNWDMQEASELTQLLHTKGIDAVAYALFQKYNKSPDGDYAWLSQWTQNQWLEIAKNIFEKGK